MDFLYSALLMNEVLVLINCPNFLFGTKLNNTLDGSR